MRSSVGGDRRGLLETSPEKIRSEIGLNLHQKTSRQNTSSRLSVTASAQELHGLRVKKIRVAGVLVAEFVAGGPWSVGGAEFVADLANRPNSPRLGSPGPSGGLATWRSR